jgi:hypothetical protein
MPELQEAPENMLFCSPEGCHLGAVGREAEHGDKAHDKQFAKVVTRVVGPGIGDVVEGGEKDVHAGNGLQKDDPHPRIHPRQNSNAPQIRSNPKRDSSDLPIRAFCLKRRKFTENVQFISSLKNLTPGGRIKILTFVQVGDFRHVLRILKCRQTARQPGTQQGK